MNKQKTLKIKNVAILGTRKDESDVDDSEEEEEEKEDDEGDYPEGVTEYDPPDSLHSCTDITMTDRLLERWTFKFFSLFPEILSLQGKHSFESMRKIARWDRRWQAAF